MKKLFVIATIVKDLFTSKLPYTAVVLISLILSFFTLFFVTTKVASEHLKSTLTEKHYSNDLFLDITSDLRNVAENSDFSLDENGNYLLDDEFYDRYLKLDLPTTTFASIMSFLKYSKLNNKKLPGTDFVEVNVHPLFSKSEQEKYKPFELSLKYEYDVIDGRDITEEDLSEHKNVALAPEGWAVKVGDTLDCFGHKLKIVGLLKPKVGFEYEGAYYSYHEKFLVPYGFLVECMKEPIDINSLNTKTGNLEHNPGYDDKPVDNKYVLIEPPANTTFSSDGQTCYKGKIYPATIKINLQNIIFSKKLTEKQKNDYAEFLGVSPDKLKSSYERLYMDNIKEFNNQALLECTVSGAFCVLNAVMIVLFICRKNIGTYKLFRVYGSSRKNIFIFNLVSMLSVILLALIISALMSMPVMNVFHRINQKYEFRESCLIITSAVFVVVSVLACIPAAVSAVRKSPVN